MPVPLLRARRVQVLAASVLLSGTLVSPGAAAAQRELGLTAFEYAARFECGRFGWYGGPENIGAGVLYETRILVRNPGDEVVLHGTITASRGRQVRIPPTSLETGDTIDFHCNDLFRRYYPGEPWYGWTWFPIRGFLVIRSERELDVVGVYTASPDRNFATQHSERVPARRVIVPFELPGSLSRD